MDALERYIHDHTEPEEELLRELDRLGAKKIYVHAPEKDGVGLAVYNRLVRAAAFHIEQA